MKFTLGEVLSITTGRLMCDIGGVYKILGYMVGEDLMTHQLPRASKACEGPLIEQFPQLAPDQLVVPEGFGNAAEVHAWLDIMRGQLGDEFEVRPLRPGAYESMNPLEELAQMRPDGLDSVAVVVMDDGSAGTPSAP